MELLDFEHPEGQSNCCILLLFRTQATQQESESSGIRLHMYSARHLSVTTAVIFALGPRRMTASTTKWPLRTGKCYQQIIRRIQLTRVHSPRPVVNSDYPAIEKVADLAIKEKQKFERLVVPKETLLEMFAVSLRCIYASMSVDRRRPSTTNTRSTSSKARSPMVPPRRFTAAGLWWTFASGPISLTLAASRRSWSQRCDSLVFNLRLY